MKGSGSPPSKQQPLPVPPMPKGNCSINMIPYAANPFKHCGSKGAAILSKSLHSKLDSPQGKRNSPIPVWSRCSPSAGGRPNSSAAGNVRWRLNAQTPRGIGISTYEKKRAAISHCSPSCFDAAVKILCSSGSSASSDCRSNAHFPPPHPDNAPRYRNVYSSRSP